MAFTPSNSFYEEFDTKFYSMLHQRGSMLMDAVTNVTVTGSTKIMRQSEVGEAYDADVIGGITQYVNVSYDQRILTPEGFECPILLDKFDLVRQGNPDINMLAQDAADSCGKKIDQIIIKAMWQAAKTKSSGDIILPASQYVVFNDNTFAPSDYTNNQKIALNTSKIALAVQKLREQFNSAYIGCIASNYALTSLRSDPRAASVLFNTQPALASGQETPYAGVDFFRASECVPKNIPSKESEDVNVELAFVYAIDKVILGCSSPLQRKDGVNTERGYNYGFNIWGMYGAIRMQEEGVVAIEICRPNDEM